jgi:hypothetical protein
MSEQHPLLQKMFSDMGSVYEYSEGLEEYLELHCECCGPDDDAKIFERMTICLSPIQRKQLVEAGVMRYNEQRRRVRA